MATRFYLHNSAAPYTPATIRGAWDASGSAVTEALDTARKPTNTITSVTVAETSTDTEWDVLLYRGVSGPLAAGTIGTGTVNLCVGVDTTSAAADMHWHVHIYVTQGDSDTPRGTLLSDYREAAGTNEWPSSDQGWALNAAASLSSLAVSAGDRLVVELGYTARNSSSSSYSGKLYYGSGLFGDLTATSTYVAVHNGWIEFSEALSGTGDARASQGPVETLLTETSITTRASQGPVEVLFIHDPNGARLTQVVAETSLTRTAGSGLRISQVVVEVICPGVIPARLSQMVVEVANAPERAVRVSQHLVEVLAVVPSYCGPPSLSPAVLCGKPDVLAWLEWTVPMKES